MDKKPLIGVSICAVVLLVLGSLSNVVGYQSVKSTAVNDSPLFITRTQKAIKHQQNIIISQYLGMGKQNLLRFPVRDNKTESILKAIEYISKMDDTVFAQFTELCIKKARQDINLRDVNSNKIIEALHLLRKNPKIIINSFINMDNQNITSSNMNTICNWYPGCTLFTLYFILVVILVISVVYTGVLIEALINLVSPTSAWWCHSVMICK